MPDWSRQAYLLVALAALAAMHALASVVGRARGRRGRRIVPKRLLTGNEVEFMKRLSSALPEHVVLAQVAMGALLSSGTGRGRFDRKVVDFVVCDRASLDVVVLVELDDRTHSARADRDRDAMTREAGYRTLRYASRNKPSRDRIAADVAGGRR